MVSRVVLQLWIFQARGLAWWMENPSRSIIKDHPRFQQFLQHFASLGEEYKIWQRIVDLGSFEADTLKPIVLWSPDKMLLDDLSKFESDRCHTAQDKDKTVWKFVQDGHLRVTGKADPLKQSQHYPVHFGVACARVYASHEQKFKARAAKRAAQAAKMFPMDDIDGLLKESPQDAWDDADLDSIFAKLRQ